MEEALAKIRPHTHSKLAHQKAPASLLQAIEATFSDQNTQRTPTAYFAALVSTLDAILQKNETGLEEGDVLPAELYLLALVLPFVPSPVIRAHLQTLLSLTSPLFPELIPHAPPLRSQLTLYQTIFLSVDRSHLEVQGLRQSFASILNLCSDPRPKVRKKAAELVKEVLASPPPPLARHPYAERAAEWVRSSLAEMDASAFARSTASRVDTTIINNLIHLLAFLRPTLPHLPPSVSCIYCTVDCDLTCRQTLPSIINLLISLPCAFPEWLLVMGSATFFSSQVASDSFATVLIKVWTTVWTSLESADAATRNAAAQSLDTLTKCITPDLIEAAIKERISDTPKSTLSKMIALSTKALDSLAYANSIPHVLEVISSLIKALRFKSSRSAPTATETLLLPIIQKIGELKISKGFEHKSAADAALATAMRVVGPKVLLRVLPLNLEPG
jgi:ribosomal RNA-processing protein 12